MLTLTLDRASPSPLYHQIAQAIRWRIGTGALVAGESLPPIRDAAERWGVNYHTVRRAYGELARQGLVESAKGSGTQVTAVATVVPSGGEDDLDDWVERIITTAHERYGLSAQDLASIVNERGRMIRVVMVECNQHQSGFLAQQLEEAWQIEAIPWSLEERAEPPGVPIIGTYFHYAEMRRWWPHRIGDMHFVALHLDPGLKERVEAIAAERGTRILRLVDEDPATAREMAAGVSALFRTRFEVESTVGDPDEMLRALPGDELLLIAPRLWDRLSSATRHDQRVFDVRHVIVPQDLGRVWQAIIRGATAVTR